MYPRVNAGHCRSSEISENGSEILSQTRKASADNIQHTTSLASITVESHSPPSQIEFYSTEVLHHQPSMEGIVRRTSIDDSPFAISANSPSYPSTVYGDDGQQGRDVLALELNHHEMGGNYLDPRSFGGYDDFNSSISYELPTSFVDNNSQMDPPMSVDGYGNDSIQQNMDSLEIPPRNNTVAVYRVKTAEPPPSMQYIHINFQSIENVVVGVKFDIWSIDVKKTYIFKTVDKERTNRSEESRR
ncbi:hypothetical protein WR25_04004 [Diploscapter pachys]|uniref:Uncharacterized protein n=1 Tax=Diploscapter pachys TaxID=2018661 RepID=A0A2A2JAT9_9BILA|nr:hypothetical protein WR25_04004 [Diploscapter pachys]